MINTVVLMGRLTEYPELKQTKSGLSVTSFSVAVDRGYAAKGGDRQTDFIRCVAWRQTAEFICKYFSKGQMIALTGSVQTRSYTDKDGNNRTAVEVVAGQASFCGSKAESEREAPPQQAAKPNIPIRVEDFADIGKVTGDPDGFTDESDLPF